ncbi:MAG: sigma 54-interacting transcriptional regulator [Acidobacteriota bacterium]
MAEHDPAAHESPWSTPSMGDAETVQETESWNDEVDLLVPGLTILWHPDLSRVGERAALPALGSGRAIELGRLEPGFTPADGGNSLALGDARISRTPIRLVPAGDGLRLERGASRTPVEVDGEALDESIELSGSDLERGVVLLLGQRIVLLLHRLDPLLPRDLPRHGMIGESPTLLQVRRDIGRVADLDVSVLVLGETGTGKELVARALHAAGPRHGASFVAVDMASLPPSLAAAELFGAAKGAFTGADRHREGHFVRADRGTLFLDEIGETPGEVQPMLLRVLETRRVQPVGGDTARPVDVRVVAATDRDLHDASSDGGFRAPLFHRLAGFVLRLPPLRDRREDLGRLLVAFLRREMAAVGDEKRLDADEPWLPAPWVARLARHDWPGNVRQLANVVRQIVIANRGAARATRFDDVDSLLASSAPRSEDGESSCPANAQHPSASSGDAQRFTRRPADVRESELIDALRRHRWRPQAAADDLGIARASIYELIDRSPNIRKASELGRDEIDTALAAADGSVEHAAEALEVSAQGLRRRIGQLDSG